MLTSLLWWFSFSRTSNNVVLTYPTKSTDTDCSSEKFLDFVSNPFYKKDLECCKKLSS